MKIIIAPDSFKESCRAVDVARAIANGVYQACPGALVDQIPLSDGGEGLLCCFGDNNQKVTCQVTGPIGKQVDAQYVIVAHGGKQTAIIEMAAAAGIELVDKEERNPLLTTSFGVGELILDAYNRGCREFYLGLGGSATCDCGCGMAQALGVEFFDDKNNKIEPQLNASLNSQVKYISDKKMKIKARDCRFTGICDVSNSLLGNDGAAFIFAPQKGANQRQVLQIEYANSLIVSKIENEIGRSLRNMPGSGAAGGLGVALSAFLGGKLEPGINIVLRITDFYSRIKDADLIITGEGAMDHTTNCGKVVSGVINAAAGIPVIALCGSINGDLTSLYKQGLTAAYSICPRPLSLAKAIESTSKNLSRTAEQVMRTYLAGRQS